jgi:hypothetical protein
VGHVKVGLLLAASLAAQTVAIQDLSDPRRGRISVLVVDEKGQPAPGTTVSAWPPGPLGAIVPHTLTDAKGTFALAGLLPGRTFVSAANEEAFYPSAVLGLWDEQGSAEVYVPAGGAVSGILLALKPAGRLQVEARNGLTGEVIDAISVRLERDGAPEKWMAGSKAGNWWLVPTAPIRLCVDAQGYRPAWYREPLTLSPRQVFTAVVALYPASGPAPESCSGRNGGTAR